jgi:hypothetical protein
MQMFLSSFPEKHVSQATCGLAKTAKTLSRKRLA